MLAKEFQHIFAVMGLLLFDLEFFVSFYISEYVFVVQFLAFSVWQVYAKKFAD